MYNIINPFSDVNFPRALRNIIISVWFDYSVLVVNSKWFKRRNITVVRAAQAPGRNTRSRLHFTRKRCRRLRIGRRSAPEHYLYAAK